MRVIFMGTPDFSVPTLRALVNSGHDVAGVFTQPDRRAGRGKTIKPGPVKRVAEEYSLPVFQPERIKTQEGIDQLKKLKPECIVVVAYGQILSREILELPGKGCINVHASLLPAYRGAAPIHWAVMRGESRTGVTTMMMDEGLDTGDILLKREIPIAVDATTGDIHDKLADLGAELLIETLQEIENGNLKSTPQTGESNYAPLLKREHERLDWTRRAKELHDQIRGLNPWPGAFSAFRGERLKLWRSTLEQNDSVVTDSSQPGQIMEVSGDSLLVGTGKGVLRVSEVQPSGKRPMSARDFFNGRHGQVGEKFE